MKEQKHFHPKAKMPSKLKIPCLSSTAVVSCSSGSAKVRAMVESNRPFVQGEKFRRPLSPNPKPI